MKTQVINVPKTIYTNLQTKSDNKIEQKYISENTKNAAMLTAALLALSVSAKADVVPPKPKQDNNSKQSIITESISERYDYKNIDEVHLGYLSAIILLLMMYGAIDVIEMIKNKNNKNN